MAQDKDKESINLGLEDLLIPEERDLIKTAEPDEVRAVVDEGLGQGAPESPEALFWNKREYTELIERVEKRLSENEDDIEARLWWIRAQLCTQGIPQAILEATLNDLSSAIEAAINKESTEEGGRAENIKYLYAEVKTALGQTQELVESKPKGRPAKEEMASIDKPPLANARRGSNLALILVIIVLFLGGGMVFYSYRAEKAREDLAFDNSRAGSGMPTTTSLVDTRKSQDEVSSVHINPLQSVFEDLERLNNDQRAVDVVPRESIKESVTQTPFSSQSIKERINTTSPSESEKPRIADAGAPIVTAKAQKTDPLAATERSPFGTDVITTGRGVSDGYDPPGYEVDKFSEPKRFKVVARSTIYSRPSLRARKLGDLLSGERVMADATFGGWLQLRSKSGSQGFMLAQDATPD